MWLIHNFLPDTDDDDDTLVTASVFNSPSESLQDLPNSIPIAPYEKFSYNSVHETGLELPSTKRSSSDEDDDDGSDDTLVDGASMASSCNTYISEGGDAYKCARSEFVYSQIDKVESIPRPMEIHTVIVTARYDKCSLRDNAWCLGCMVLRGRAWFWWV